MKFVTYKRLSKQNKGKAQHGFASQQRDIEYFLEGQSDYTIEGEFQEFVSGGADIKPELEKAMALCEEIGAVLVIAKVDRLSRRISQVSQYLEGTVKFRIACMPQADNFQIAIYAILAEQERTFIRDRIVKGLRVAKESGVLLGGASPKHKASFKANRAKGLHKVNRNVQASRLKAQPIVEELKKIISYGADRLNQTEIADRLNLGGFRTSRGGMFTKSSVSAMIKKYGISEYRPKNKSKRVTV